MNGSNNDPESRTIYEDWKARHKGTDAISGSKSADMKAAIVEAFRDSKTILIATESGAEGINLQFCSLLINFDLPWNPQRVEQRIGRCHRYGQKIDVTVVNLLNLKNQAELRVHQLLDQKFRLFSGVFGASDEVLGTIEKGVDFERRVLEIVQNCRSDVEVVAAFQALEDDLQLNIDADMLDTRKKLLENLDQDVVRLLQRRNQDIEGVMNAFDQRLMTLAKAELPEAQFHGGGKPRFDWNGKTWTNEWPLADEMGWGFFRFSDGNLATELADRAKARKLSPATIEFRYALAEHGVLADVRDLVGKGGWLTASIFRVKAAGKVVEQVLVAAVSDDGVSLESATAERLFLIPGTDAGPPAEILPETLQARQIVLRQQLGEEAQRRSSQWFTEEEEKLERYGDDLEKSLDVEIDAIEEQMQELKRTMRQPNLDLAEKVNIKRQISGLDARPDELIAERYARKKRIRDDINKMLDEIAESLKLAPEESPLFTIRWEVSA